jgi:hypothetical protein
MTARYLDPRTGETFPARPAVLVRRLATVASPQTPDGRYSNPLVHPRSSPQNSQRDLRRLLGCFQTLQFWVHVERPASFKGCSF